MKSFTQVVQEIKTSFDRDDYSILAAIEDAVEDTLTATVNHPINSYLVYDKKIWRMLATVNAGGTLVPSGSGVTGNMEVADDIMSMITTLNTYKSSSEAEIATLANWLGAKNLFKMTATDDTIDGITFDVQSDGVYVSGTVSGSDPVEFVLGTFTPEKYKSAKYVGCPSGGSNTTYGLKLEFSGGPGGGFTQYDYGGGYIYSPAYDFTVTISIIVYPGAGTINPAKVFTPMVMPTAIKNEDYVEYVPTNKELATENQALTNQKADLADEILFFKDQTVTATSGTICTISNSAITTDHVVVECQFSNPSLVTSDIGWSTDVTGACSLTGTCSSITNLTVSVTLAKKGN